MPIASTDLWYMSSLNDPSNDTSTAGGAISTVSRPELTQFSANAVAAVISDGADTRTITVTGRLASGIVDTEDLVLNGAVEVVGAKTWERIFSLVASTTSASRTVTFTQGSGGTTRATISLNETTRHILFRESVSAAGSVIRYAKVFWKNNHGTLALTSAANTLTADPSAKIRVGISASKGDTATIANRLTAPAGITFVDDAVSQGVPTGNLAAGEHIGVHIEQTLVAAEAPIKSTFTQELNGATT